MNDDIEHAFEFSTENKLILNAKKGKIEVMLFGTSKRLSKLTVNLNICYSRESLNQTNRYKYLGTLLMLTIKRSLFVCRTFFLRLLEALKENLTGKARKCVYQSMVVPPPPINV